MCDGIRVASPRKIISGDGIIIMGVVYKLSSRRCEQAYIGSSIHTGQHRLKQLRRRKHPIGAYDDVVVETLHSNVAAEDLRRLGASLKLFCISTHCRLGEELQQDSKVSAT